MQVTSYLFNIIREGPPLLSNVLRYLGQLQVYTVGDKGVLVDLRGFSD